MQLTQDAAYEASSAYFSTAVPVNKFSTDFDFKLSRGDGDGFTFVLQSEGLNAIGTGGECELFLKTVLISSYPWKTQEVTGTISTSNQGLDSAPSTWPFAKKKVYTLSFKRGGDHAGWKREIGSDR